MKQFSFSIGIISFILLFGFKVSAQVILSGTVKDKSSGNPIAHVSISIVGTDLGALTDDQGKFRIYAPSSTGMLLISSLGFRTQSIPFSKKSNSFEITLEESSKVLKEVFIKPKERYRNKNNPAVALIRKVIDHKDQNRMSSYENLNYEEYEKILLGYLNDKGEQFNPLPFKQFDFVFENVDTKRFQGKALLPLFLEENFRQKYQKRNPNKEHEVLTGNKQIRFEDKYINNESLGKSIRYLYQATDIYENDMYIMTNSFLSPIATFSPTFYKFYIIDTFKNIDDEPYILLEFEPRNENDLLFSGELHISLDGSYAVEKAILEIGSSTNINWINRMRLEFDFEKHSDGKRIPDRINTMVFFGQSWNKAEIFGERTLIITDFDTETILTDSVFKIESQKGDNIKDDDFPFWENNRPEPLTITESRTYDNFDSVSNMKTFKRLVDWGSFIFSGYKQLGPIEIGPLGTFFSSSPLEGYKQRIAARTTPEFSNRLFLESFVAYGFKDKRWKYLLSAAYSFNRQSIYSYPFNYLQISYQNEVSIPGLGMQFDEEENILFSIKRGVNNKFLYNKRFDLNYVREFNKNIKLDIGYTHLNQEPADMLYLIRENPFRDTVSDYTTSEFQLTLRWAPHEKFLEQKNKRSPIPNRYPIFTGSFTQGLDNFLGGQYNYQKLELTINKRFYLSQFGHADAIFNAGIIKGSVPYTLLFSARADQTYNYRFRSYSLMNFLEFVSDQVLEFKIDYHTHGFILNKIPLLKKLRFREVVGFKMIYGKLSDHNKHEQNSALFQLPRDAEGNFTTFSLEQKPYMEFNIGVENILNVFRVDYVRRLSYLNNPNISRHGVRLSVRFSL